MRNFGVRSQAVFRYGAIRWLLDQRNRRHRDGGPAHRGPVKGGHFTNNLTQRCSEILRDFVFDDGGGSRGAPGAQTWPESGPGPGLTFARVLAKSALWRPHSSPKLVFAKSQKSANGKSLKDVVFVRAQIIREVLLFLTWKEAAPICFAGRPQSGAP